MDVPNFSPWKFSTQRQKRNSPGVIIIISCFECIGVALSIIQDTSIMAAVAQLGHFWLKP